MATHELGICGIVIKAEETYPWSLVVHIFRSGLPSHDGYRKTVEVMTSTSPLRILGLTDSSFAATPYQGN